MADTDNKSTLLTVTRRQLMAGVAAASSSGPFGVSARENTTRKLQLEDPTLRLCERWLEVHGRTQALCRKQQSLETLLVRTIGFQNTQEHLTSGGEANVRSVDGLSIILLPEDEAFHKAVAELAAHQAHWDAMDDQIGYSRMDEMIRQSEAIEQALLGDLLLSPATTIHGVLAKLSVVLCQAENREDPDDFPWHHIRALRNDLIRLHGLDAATNPRSEKQQNSQSR
ncbi:hypothetical protein [Mesorhizobium carmichaelinearum]|uniref:hypothetical protein n=1 Tax=Mesorhizobium carmichaelinearum TaxID=1208188 RepID=UPI000BA30EAF|nr:hypothetical protein [Mesorhizobium carmichaelinearum]